MSQSVQIVSPCVSNCCLDDKDMCLGCFRLMDEILNWSQSSDEQKQLVLDACDKRRDEHAKKYKNYFSS